MPNFASNFGFLSLAGGTMEGDIAMASGKLVDTRDVDKMAGGLGGIYRDANVLNITTGTVTVINCNQYMYGNPDGVCNISTYRIMLTIAGWYLIFGAVRWQPTTANKQYRGGCRIVSGAIIVDDMKHSANAADQLNCHFVTLYLASGLCYIELVCYHNEGVNTPDIIAGIDATYLGVVRIRGA